MSELLTISAEPRQEGSSRAPLLILLHGFGSNEDDLMGLAEYVDPRYRVISVRAPIRLDMGGNAWFAIEFSPVGMVMDIEQGMRSRDQLLDLLQTLQKKYGNDGSDTVAVGFSQGGAMALSLLMAKPAQLAGVAFLSGVWLRELLPQDDTILKALQGKPVLQTHGSTDPLLPISKAHRTREVLNSLPIDLQYKEYPMGHEINPACLKDLKDWLASRLPAADST